MGSKSRIAKYIIPIIQSYVDDKNNKGYFEPFCGGCNVIDKIVCNKKYASDANEYLIELLKYVQCGGELPEEVSREKYSEVRSNRDNFEKWYVGAIGFLASYNGRFFDGGYAQPGYEGKRYRDYYQEAKRNLLEQKDNLNGIVFAHKKYQDTHPVNFIVYADPPYKDTKQFDNSKNFDHELFWNTMTEWSKNNVVLVSELTAPDDWKCIWEQEVSRSIKSNDKSKAMEKLFIHKSNYYM